MVPVIRFSYDELHVDHGCLTKTEMNLRPRDPYVKVKFGEQPTAFPFCRFVYIMVAVIWP